MVTGNQYSGTGKPKFVGEHNGEIIGFISGSISQNFRKKRYIHFIDLTQPFRKCGLGRTLYERFFAAVQNLAAASFDVLPRQ